MSINISLDKKVDDIDNTQLSEKLMDEDIKELNEDQEEEIEQNIDEQGDIYHFDITSFIRPVYANY